MLKGKDGKNVGSYKKTQYFFNFQIIKHYNWPHMPVRIFSYLIGGGSSSRESMHNIACSNKGMFSHEKKIL